MPPASARSERPAEQVSIETIPVGLSFGDGFLFGCGFFVAGMIAAIVLLLAILLVVLLLSLTGVGLFGSLLGRGLPGPWPVLLS